MKKYLSIIASSLFVLSFFIFAGKALALTSQAITVSPNAPATATYGDTFPVGATSDSSLVVDISTTGGCSVSGGIVTITSGTVNCAVHYNQAGDGTYDAAPEVIETVVVSKAPLTITAQNKTKAYGDVNPALTASYVGFVSGDTAPVLDTPVVLDSLADGTSVVGDYAINASGATSSNYL